MVIQEEVFDTRHVTPFILEKFQKACYEGKRG